LTRRYLQEYPLDYKPKRTGEAKFERLSFKSKLPVSEAQDIISLRKHFVKVKFLAKFRITDHLDNVSEFPLVLVYDGYLGHPTLIALYKEASQLYASKKYNEAVKQFTYIIERDPYYEQAYYLLGMTYIRLDSEEPGIEALLKASKLGHSNANLELAKYYWDTSDVVKTVHFLNLYLNKGKKIKEGLTEENIKSIQTQLLEPILGKMEILQLSRKEKKSLSLIYYQIGIMYQDAEKYSDAIQTFLNSTKFSPNNLPAHSKLGDIYFEREDYVSAGRFYSKAMNLLKSKNYIAVDSWDSRDTMWNHFYLGLCYWKMKNHKKSIEMFQTLIISNPNQYEGFIGKYGLAVVYEDFKDFDSSIKYLNEALSIAQENEYGVEEINLIKERLKAVREKSKISAPKQKH